MADKPIQCAPGLKLSQLVNDGRFLTDLPGLANQGIRGDQFPFLIETGKLDFHNGTVVYAQVPFDCYVVAASVSISAALDVASTIEIGSVRTAADSVVASTAVGTGAAGTEYPLTPKSTAQSMTVNSELNVVDLAPLLVTLAKGDLIKITPGTDSTAGIGYGTILIIPK